MTGGSHDGLQAETHTHNSLFVLPKNDFTARVATTCFQFLQRLIISRNGLRYVTRSRLLDQLKRCLVRSYRRHAEQQPAHDLCDAVITFIAVFTYYDEGMLLLREAGIISQLVEFIYEPGMMHFQKLLLHKIAITTQSCEARPNTACTRCAGGHNCCASSKFDDQLNILANSAMSNSDVATRYCYVFHLGLLLKERKYLLERYQPNECRCLCKNCISLSITGFQLITPASERAVIQNLTCLINDVQPEIGLMAIFILEEFLDPDDDEVVLKVREYVEKWSKQGFMLQSLLLQNKRVLEQITKEDVQKMFNF